jgi:hypothetical protein
LAERFELHLERVLDQPYGELESALRAGPEGWLPGVQRQGDELTAELAYVQAGSRISRRIEIDVGPVQRFAYGVTVHVRWKAARHAELYPELDGHLRLERRRPSGCNLRLDARYAPPGGRLGAAADRALMHHVAESSVRDFLDRVAELLASG